MKIVNALIAAVVFIIGIELLGLLDIAILSLGLGEQLYPYLLPIRFIVELGIIIYFLYRVYGWEKLRPKETQFGYYLLAAALGFIYVYVQELLAFFYESFVPSEDRLPGSYQFSLRALLENFQFGIVVILPIAEELFFRRYIQHELQKSYRPFEAILFASFTFALVHLPFYSLLMDNVPFSFYTAYIAFFGGLISGVLYYKTKSILPSVVFHIAWNFTAGGFIFVWE